MVQPVKRRQANVHMVQQLLSGIGYIRYQKQISNVERLARYMEREHGTKQSEVEKQLHYAVLDNLILSYTGVGFKGSKTGIEYEGFRVPDPGEVEQDDDGHDWYCFECHMPGEMYACSDCWRVFHADCQDEDTDDIKYMCAVCRAARKKKKTKRKLLNTLLSYTIVRLKEKTRELHRVGHREEEKKFMPMFVYKPMDLNKMEQKVMAHKYKCIEEFLADAHNVLHNMVLIYGDEPDGMTDLARIMIKDCKYDIDEMGQCQNCYYMSNAKPRHWFAQPCDPPHELVYAKLKGFCYWPAKVIRYMDENRYDVRFFGGLHQRAVIQKDQIKPIDTEVKKLNVKKTSAFNKSMEELKVHQKLLKERKEQEEEEEEDAEEEELEMAHGEELEEEPEPVTPTVTKNRHKAENSSKKTENSSKKRDREKEYEFEFNETDTVTSSSNSKRSKSRKVSSPEDANIVTSTEEYAAPPSKRPKLSYNTTGSQTRKPSIKAVGSQTDEWKPEVKPDSKENSPKLDEPPKLDPSISTGSDDADPNAKFTRKIEEMKEKLEAEYAEKQQKALDELSERLHTDFEEDKQQAVSRAMSKLQTELDRVRQKTEEKCKEQYKDEMKKLAQKHKETISQTKKKQWCFNCEEEAMYHCCWNTSYCSVKCQQEHWHKEHKRVCRRKRCSEADKTSSEQGLDSEREFMSLLNKN